jgi:hypothetical protein
LCLKRGHHTRLDRCELMGLGVGTVAAFFAAAAIDAPACVGEIIGDHGRAAAAAA